MKISYQDYSQELENTKRKLEEQTCAAGISNQIWIVNVGTDEDIQMGVNVSGTGDMSAVCAKRFAGCIEIAADIAKNFKYNGYSLR